MDILEHSLDTSGETEEVLDIDNKDMLTQNLTIVDEGSLGSGGEEQNNVSHLSPQALLEPNVDTEVQYSFRSPEGTITYKVLQVEDGIDMLPQIVSSSSFGNAGVQQVLTSQLNGQVYVIGNAGEVFNSQTQRTITPRTNILDSTTSVSANLKKVHRDERRRATHNEVERRRRDKINNWIMKLGKIIPDNGDVPKGTGSFDGQSKGGILAKACEYITELRQANVRLTDCLKENGKFRLDLDELKRQNDQLRRDNSILRNLLTQHGVTVPKEFTQHIAS